MSQYYTTKGGMRIDVVVDILDYRQGIDYLIKELNTQRGCFFKSSYDYPGRYTCWDVAFINPPLSITFLDTNVSIEALNERGIQLLGSLRNVFQYKKELSIIDENSQLIRLQVIKSDTIFSEEERSQQPSVFTVIREILNFFKADNDSHLGLYGAFGYDLIFQFEALEQHQIRDLQQRDMVLYLPDEIYVVDHRKEEAKLIRYEFQFKDFHTKGFERSGQAQSTAFSGKQTNTGDHAPGEYAASVVDAKERFACGDLFEVVLSQTLYKEYHEPPSDLFKKMCAVNPAPYGFFINLGDGEYLVGASPEMYVRVQGRRVETCPISGTIRRGADAIEDAENIQQLLDSKKEESELTMCTDVDRNDKSRICEAGSVNVIGRRQIEMYSRVIHTVDHVEGILRENFDAVDAFLTHMWVVTVTGAPKLWAMNFIEKKERSPRKWYGGAVGWFNFNGNLNTGLVLRTVRLKGEAAEVRVGATLLYDSVPELEEQETLLKASAFVDILNNKTEASQLKKNLPLAGHAKKILLVDHQDSFVHTLANYFRQTGAEVQTVRYDNTIHFLKNNHYDLVVLSPGPGKPSDFGMSKNIDYILKKNIPIFGVCLGLQALVEYYGGTLKVLDYPMHGKASYIKILKSKPLFEGLGKAFKAGRYHSLYADRDSFPSILNVTAHTDDDIIMSISHKELPIHAVQFHPETILSMVNKAGLQIINNLMQSI